MTTAKRPEPFGCIDLESDAELFTFGLYDPLSDAEDPFVVAGRILQATDAGKDVGRFALKLYAARNEIDSNDLVHGVFELWKLPGWQLAMALEHEPDEIKLKVIAWLNRHRRHGDRYRG